MDYMKKVILVLIIICFGLAGIAYESAQNSGWEKADENSYVNMEGIEGTKDRYGFTFLLKSFNKGQYEPINGKKISYTLGQYTIDCGRKTYKIGVIDSYDKDDNFVSGDYNRYSKFQPIIEGTAVWNMSKKLCRF